MIGIINCDLDKDIQTNGAHILNRLINDSVIINLVDGEFIYDLQAFDGFVITGSRASFEDNHMWLDYLRSCILSIHDSCIPCLAICFGMHVVADSFGGSVRRDLVNELGFVDVSLIPWSSAKRLFEGVSRTSPVYESHHDAVLSVPKGSEIIASNKNCVQGFVFDNFYCVQFHPEISSKVAILMAKRDGDEVDAMLGKVDSLYDAPALIVQNFVKLVENELVMAR